MEAVHTNAISASSYETHLRMASKAYAELEEAMESNFGYTTDPVKYAQSVWEKDSPFFVQAFQHVMAASPVGDCLKAIDWYTSDENFIRLVFSSEVDLGSLYTIDFTRIFGPEYLVTFDINEDMTLEDVIIDMRVSHRNAPQNKMNAK